MRQAFTKKTLWSVFFVFGLLIFKLNATDRLHQLHLAQTQSLQQAAAKPQATDCPQFSQTDFKSFSQSRQNQSSGNLSFYQDKVKWVVDGDTVHTVNGHKLRLVGINAPEINPKSKKSAEPFAKAAKQKLASLIGSDKPIFWLYDRQQQDKYKRELVYVFNQQGQFLNAELIREGLAQGLFIEPNYRFWQCIVAAEKKALAERKGLWSNPLFAPKATATLKPNRGFQLIRGTISAIDHSSKYRWLILNNQLKVGISHQDWPRFEAQNLRFKVSDTLTFRGYVYQSRGKLTAKLKHPSMLLDWTPSKPI